MHWLLQADIIMDAFGDNFTGEAEVDPAAEFLAREQNDLAGLEDEIAPVVLSTPVPPAASVLDGNLNFYIIN